MPTPDIPRDEAEAVLETRRELGKEMEPAVVDAFVERVERAIDARVDARLAERGPQRTGKGDDSGMDLALPLASLGIAIPLTAVAGGTSGFLAILVVWIGIVAVNVAHARGRL
jgi:hypothetical protein